MKEDNWAPYGAAAGAVAIALYVIGSLIIGRHLILEVPG